MRALLFFLCAFLGLVSNAGAEERIESFISDVTVNADASLDVRETIVVTAEGQVIRRGILRDFPTVYTDRNGSRVRVGFEVLGVKRDGRDEPYAVESMSNGKRIKIGDADVFLDYGRHTYEIAYRTTRQLGFFDGYDELYWNVTGNGWTFAIEKATAIIRLPSGALIRQHAAYTGYQGESGDDFQVLNASGSDYRATTTRRLRPNEGFTVAVAWQKGIVAPPSENQKLGWWLADNGGLLALLGSLIATALYYVYAWNAVGRDPAGVQIIPLFFPPKGMGPAGARYVWKQGFDDRTFAAALVSLAVKGRLKIRDDDSDFAITRLADKPADDDAKILTRVERVLYEGLPTGELELKQANHVRVGAMRSAVEKELASEYLDKAFVRNISWFWTGAILSLAGLAVAVFLLPLEEGVTGLFVVGWAGIWWSVILAVAWAGIKGLIGQRGVLAKLGSALRLLFLIPFIGGGVAAPTLILSGAGSPVLYMLIGAAVIQGVMNLAFLYLLRAPTVPGRKLLDEIEGFRMYMTTAEEERLKVLHPPEKTPELFERYLPYALALDCENQWNAKFAAVLAAAAAAGAAAPSWYSGRNWDSGRTGSFTDSLGSSLASSVSSAATAPGSSSGSGGGGSSGGGGGGGGGSGW